MTDMQEMAMAFTIHIGLGGAKEIEGATLCLQR